MNEVVYQAMMGCFSAIELFTKRIMLNENVRSCYDMQMIIIKTAGLHLYLLHPMLLIENDKRKCAHF